MTAWLARNSTPIAIVLIAAALVIGVFEVIDAVAGSGSSVAAIEPAADETADALTPAGLVKVSAFLLAGAGLTRLVRRSIKNP